MKLFKLVIEALYALRELLIVVLVLYLVTR